jgi:chromosomal replication initiation ATPase DnaA
VGVEQIMAVVEQKWGRKWQEFAERHGDWGRDLAAHLARKRSGLTLKEIGEALGGLECKTVGKAVQRFEASLVHDQPKRKVANECLSKLSLVET